MDPHDVIISHQEQQHRFVAHSGNEELGVLIYDRLPHALDIRHTVVEPHAGGRGIGSALVRAALDAARAEHLGIVPTCSFVRPFITKHPAYEDLLTT